MIDCVSVCVCDGVRVGVYWWIRVRWHGCDDDIDGEHGV